MEWSLVDGYGEMDQTTHQYKAVFLWAFFGKKLENETVADIPSSSNEVKIHSQMSNLKPKK